MKSIGVDIVRNDRFLMYLNNERKLSRILSVKELNVLKKINNEQKQVEYVASRFCAKEALYKAGIKDDFNLISILNYEDKKPYVECSSTCKIEISISHEEEYSIVFVIVF